MEKIPEQKPKNGLNEVSSTELMRGIIEKQRREKIVESAQRIIELEQLKAEMHENDEFGNPAPGVTEAAYIKTIEEKEAEIKKLDKDLEMFYDQESHLRTADAVAAEVPTSDYLQQNN
jgi:hypothetical protein